MFHENHAALWGATLVAQAAGKTKRYGQYRVAVTEEVAVAVIMRLPGIQGIEDLFIMLFSHLLDNQQIFPENRENLLIVIQF